MATSELDEVLRQRLAAFVPPGTPPFARVVARRRRRLARRAVGCVAALAAVGTAGVPVVSALSSDRVVPAQVAAAPESVPEPAVPADLQAVAGAPVVLPVQAPEGYAYEATTATAMNGTVLSRSVLLRPPDLTTGPTVELCSDVSEEQDRCPAAPDAVRREVDGAAVTIVLRGGVGRPDRTWWQDAPLTTDPQASSLFS